MIYAKCVRSSQMTKNSEEFYQRQSEKYKVYCKGEITKSDVDNLYCVPLNFIYNCLKHGDLMAIIEVENSNINYPNASSHLSYQIATTEQKVLDVIDLYTKEGIDFVFNNVDNVELVHSDYVQWLSEDLQKYFKKRLSA
ncbi:MAG: hypothetical protein LBM93_07975 [Oscillospiraceae bacterium]|jgi:hypothetical protein|nr:hypothetical protein [Oscillospiraceae bacterium]